MNAPESTGIVRFFMKIYARAAYKPDFVQGLPPWMTIPLKPWLPMAL
jgi:hypothetical protein